MDLSYLLLPIDHPFRILPNVPATPHIGYVTQENYTIYFNEAIEDIVAFFRINELGNQPIISSITFAQFSSASFRCDNISFLAKLSLLSLSMAFLFTLILIGLNYFKCRRISVFMLFGVALWIAVLKSGVHATLAGIVIAMTIPDEGKRSMLTRLDHANRIYQHNMLLLLLEPPVSMRLFRTHHLSYITNIMHSLPR